MRPGISFFPTLALAALLAAPGVRAQPGTEPAPGRRHGSGGSPPIIPPSTPSTPNRLPSGGVLSLDDAIALALKHNPTLLAALKLVESAEAQLKGAYAPYYPQVNMSLSDVKTNTELLTQARVINGVTVDGTAGPLFSTVRTATGTLGVNYTILDFGRRHLNMESFDSALEAQRQQARTTELSVVELVRQQYFQTDTDFETLRAQQETVSNQRHHLNRALGYYKAGLQAKNEVTKAASDLASAQLTLVQDRNTLELDWVQLNQDMGLPRNTEYELLLGPIQQELLDLQVEPMIAAAYKHRPEALQLKAQIDQTLYQMEVNYSNRYPTLSGSASGGVAGPDLALPSYWTVGLTLQWNIFNGFLDRYAAASLRAQAESLAQQYEQERQAIYKDVMSAYLTLGNSREAIEVSSTNLASSVDNFRLANQRYDTGLGNNLEFEDAQVLLTRSRIGEITASNSYRIAVAQLLRAVGVDSTDQLREALKS